MKYMCPNEKFVGGAHEINPTFTAGGHPPSARCMTCNIPAVPAGADPCVRCTLPREKHAVPSQCDECGTHHPAYACIPPRERSCDQYHSITELLIRTTAGRVLIRQLGEISADRDQLRTALAGSIDGANALRAKLATALEKQAACIGHTADLIACRVALKGASRALAHYRDDEDPALVSVRSALARISTQPDPPRGIYFASKVEHAPRWRELRTRGIPVVSTWIDEAGPGDSGDYGDLWIRCINEAAHAACVIAYAEPGEVMKGALAEIGAALAHGVPVIYVGPAMDKGVTKHPLVSLAPDIESAIRASGAR